MAWAKLKVNITDILYNLHIYITGTGAIVRSTQWQGSNPDEYV